MSSASESDATLKEKDQEWGIAADERGVVVSEGGVATVGEVGGATEGKHVAGNSAVYNIHLSLPGVPQPVDVMVSVSIHRSRVKVHVCLCVS